MKILLVVVLILISPKLFAGGRHLYCLGNKVQMDMDAKGPRPIEETTGVVVPEGGVTLQQLAYVENDNSYSFHIFYQSKEPGTGYAAVLEYLGGKHRFSVFKNGDLIETILCRLGF